MLFNRTILIFAVTTGLLAGCESEQEKTIREQKSEIQKLSAELHECKTDPMQVSMTTALTKAKETQFEKDAIEARKLAKEKEIEEKKVRDVTIAAACESFGLNLCPSKMTEAGLHWNKTEGIAPEIHSMVWWWAVLLKYGFGIVALCFLYSGIAYVHGLRLKNQIADLAELKQEIEENKGLREQMLGEVQQHQARLKEIKEEQDANLDRYEFYLAEAKENLDEQEREVEKLEIQIEELEEKRDSLLNDAKQVQDALDAFAPTKRKK